MELIKYCKSKMNGNYSTNVEGEEMEMYFYMTFCYMCV